jgi:hypothetical protein
VPRAQRTKSAGHEALQRRVDERPGDSFSGKLAGETMVVFLAAHPVLFSTLALILAMNIASLARPAAAFTFCRLL